MEIFQYARVILGFDLPKSAEVRECETYISITKYDESGKQDYTKEYTGDKLEEEKFYYGRYSNDYTLGFGWSNPNYPIGKMTPIFAKMGSEGWEVVDFKYSSNENSFANALLKRKVTKE